MFHQSINQGSQHQPKLEEVEIFCLVAPWPGRAGLWGAGDQPCCGIAGAGTDWPEGLKWGPAPWQNQVKPQGSWAGTGRFLVPSRL